MNVRAPMTEEIRLTSILARQREAFFARGRAGGGEELAYLLR
jgi:hypothetical protein